MERYATQNNNYFSYFLDKMNTLLTSPEAVAVMADTEDRLITVEDNSGSEKSLVLSEDVKIIQE